MKLFVEKTDLKDLKKGDRLWVSMESGRLMEIEVVEPKEDGVLVLYQGTLGKLIQTEEPQCR